MNTKLKYFNINRKTDNLQQVLILIIWLSTVELVTHWQMLFITIIIYDLYTFRKCSVMVPIAKIILLSTSGYNYNTRRCYLEFSGDSESKNVWSWEFSESSVQNTKQRQDPRYTTGNLTISLDNTPHIFACGIIVKEACLVNASLIFWKNCINWRLPLLENTTLRIENVVVIKGRIGMIGNIRTMPTMLRD